MDNDKMIRQVNQIAEYFKVYPQQRAEEGVEGHIRKFWEPRMRAQLLDYAATDGSGLHPLVATAVEAIRADTGQAA